MPEENRINDRLDKLESQNSTLGRLVIFIPIVTAVISLIIGYFLNSRLEEEKDYSNKIEITHKMLISLRTDTKLALATNTLIGALFKNDEDFVQNVNKLVYSVLEEQVKDSSKSDDTVVVQSANNIIEFARKNGGEFGIEFANKLSDTIENRQDRLRKALSLEREGFRFLLDREISKAKNKFEECEKIFPGFHSVNEIAKYLGNFREPVSNQMIKEIFKTITEKYSWKAPEKEIEIMKGFLKNQ